METAAHLTPTPVTFRSTDADSKGDINFKAWSFLAWCTDGA